MGFSYYLPSVSPPNANIADTLVFNLPTPDANGCFVENPYIVNDVVVFYVERDFVDGNPTEYDNTTLNPNAASSAAAAAQLACVSPTQANILAAAQAAALAQGTATTTQTFYNTSTTVAIFGSDIYPAWLSSDTTNAIITNIPTDTYGNPLYGVFQLTWTPLGMREGDYFICWTWTPLPAGPTITNSFQFSLLGNTILNVALPSQRTDPTKYYTLLTRYLPETFKEYLCSADLTPQTFDMFNQAVAMQFTDLENLANATIDLINANVVDQSFLPLLANFFDLQLRTNDPTRWRRQIGQAIPLFKQKGTLMGLTAALDQAGISLTNYTQLWQIVSQYTWIDQFTSDGTGLTFELSHTAQPFDTNNFQVSYLPVTETSFTVLSDNYVSLSTVGNTSTITWLGDSQTPAIHLNTGDIILILYLINPIPGSQQSLENYVRTLPQADQRSPQTQIYPPVNWNVRLISPTDPLFSTLIPQRNPYVNPLIYGMVRTEMAYGENAYNMDEWDGSTRPSPKPCDLDKNFLDPCGACISSKYTLDVGIEDLTDARITECLSIVTEFTPFHAQLQMLNVSGTLNDYILNPMEDIEMLVQVLYIESVLSGENPVYFNRAIPGCLSTTAYERDMLASSTLVVSNASATGYNQSIVLFCPNVKFDELDMTASNFLEILSPAPQAGIYNLTNPMGNLATINTISEPFSGSPFSFRLSNTIYSNFANLANANSNEFGDTSKNWGELGVKSDWDVAHDPTYTGGPWKVSITSPIVGTFTVHQVLPDGNMTLNDPSSILPNATGVTYTLLTDTNVSVETSSTGFLNITTQGKITFTAGGLTGANEVAQEGYYIHYAGQQYLLTAFVEGDPFSMYIAGYNSGSVGGAAIIVYERLVDVNDGYGLLYYYGLEIVTLVNQETGLPISNGENPPPIVLENNTFKENYLVLIDTNYYAISDINATLITLSGPMENWGTMATAGTPITYSIYQFTKLPVTVGTHQYDFMDRRGKEEIVYSGLGLPPGEITTPLRFHASVLNQKKEDGQPLDVIVAQENIGIKIEHKDGHVEERKV